MAVMRLKCALALLLVGGVVVMGAGLFAPPGPRTHTDRHGDPLPERALARIGSDRLRSTWGARALAFSPDGKLLVSADEEHLRWWDAATGKEVRHFNARIGQLRALAFSPDGKYLAAGGGGGPNNQWMGLWEVSSGKAVPAFKGQQGYTNTLAFSPDRAVLASGGYGNTICLWEVPPGRQRARLFPPGAHEEKTDPKGRPIGGSIRGTVENVQFSPDGKTLASHSADRDRQLTFVQSWDVATGKERGRMKTYKGEPIAVRFSPDTRRALIQQNNRLTVVDLESGKESPLPLARPGDQLLTFSPDGKKLLTWGANRQVRCWDAATGARLMAFRCPHDGVPVLAFSRDGKTLATGGGSASLLRFWDAGTGKDISPTGTTSDTLSVLAFLPDGKTLLTGSLQGRIHQWIAATGAEVRHVEGEADDISGLSLSSDGKTLATIGRNKGLRLRRWPGGEEIRRIDNGGRPWKLSGDGESAAWADDKGTAVVIRLSTGREVGRIDRAGRPLAFPPDGRRLATFGPEGTVDLWDIATATLLRRFGAAQKGRMFWDSPYALAFSPDGTALALVWTGHFKPGDLVIWDVPTGRKLPHFEGWGQQLKGWVNGTSFSPDGRTVFLRVENHEQVEIRACDLFTARELGRLKESAKESTTIRSGYPQTLFVSPDGRLLASLEWGRSALVWDVARLVRRPPQPRQVSAAELARAWPDLGAADPGQSYDAVAKFLDAADGSVRFLQERLRPVAAVDPQRLRQFLADLDSDQFPVREAASRELGRLGSQAEPALRAVLQGRPSLETRKRIQSLLEALSAPPSSGTLRTLRAIQVLERIGSPGARKLLQILSGGAAGAVETREARAALQRLSRR